MNLAAIILLFAAGVYLSAHYTWWRRPRPWKQGWPRILMYHRVNPSLPRSGMNVPPDVFERHLKLLKSRKAVFCTLSELAERMDRREKGRFVALTFDDGFDDNLEHAFPLIRNHGAKMTVFYAAGYKSIPRLLPKDIAAMQASGLVEFGAHSLTHANLTTLDDAAAKQEIVQSKTDVEQLTGVPCRCFAYPYGRFEDKHMRMVEAAGMNLAVSVKKKVLPWNITDRLAIPRIGVNGEMNGLQFHLALTRGRYRL